MTAEIESGKPTVPSSGRRPAVVQVRLIAPDTAIDAASQSLADFYGNLWQPGTRKPARSSSDTILYGTVIVAVPEVSDADS